MFQLNIQNFRSFKNIDFDFSRINILIGPNNSGKSTLLKFFLMLKQSINEPESPLTVKGKLVDLGQFEDVIYQGSEKKELHFSIKTKEKYWNNLNTEIGSSKVIKTINMFLSKDYEKMSYNTNFSLSESNKINQQKYTSYEFEDCKLKIENEEIITDELYTIANIFSMDNTDKILIEIPKLRIENFGFISVFNSKYINVKQYSRNQLIELSKITKLNYWAFHIVRLLIRMYYINPLNALPKRVFEKTGKSNDLEIIVNWLAAENDEALRNQRVAKLTKLFQQMGIAEEVKLDVYRNFIEVLIKTEKDGFWINLADVGLGISLLIPMLLQAFAGEESENGNILLLEQPEIHIHPKLHENFIETLVGIGEKNTYFIETHSPFIVQKLQLMVKEGQLKPEDVAIYYFEKEGNETTATRYNIEEDGFMDKSLPESFIGNSYNLAMQLLK